MARVKRGVTARARHKKILSRAKGYYNARRKVYRVAKQAVIKALQYSYIGRKQKKRQFRALWIVRINAGARQYGLSYSRMALTKAEMAERLFTDVGLNKREAKEFVDAFFDVVRTALERGEQVKLSGFGNFDLRQ